MSRSIAAFALAGLILSPATAAETSAADADDGKKICKLQDPPIGTRLGARKVCATKKEWALLDAPRNETKMNIKRIQEWRACNGNDCRSNTSSLGGRY